MKPLSLLCLLLLTSCQMGTETQTSWLNIDKQISEQVFELQRSIAKLDERLNYVCRPKNSNKICWRMTQHDFYAKYGYDYSVWATESNEMMNYCIDSTTHMPIF